MRGVQSWKPDARPFSRSRLIVFRNEASSDAGFDQATLGESGISAAVSSPRPSELRMVSPSPTASMVAVASASWLK